MKAKRIGLIVLLLLVTVFLCSSCQQWLVDIGLAEDCPGCIKDLEDWSREKDAKIMLEYDKAS